MSSVTNFEGQPLIMPAPVRARLLTPAQRRPLIQRMLQENPDLRPAPRRRADLRQSAAKFDRMDFIVVAKPIPGTTGLVTHDHRLHAGLTAQAELGREALPEEMQLVPIPLRARGRAHARDRVNQRRHGFQPARPQTVAPAPSMGSRSRLSWGPSFN